MAACSVKEYCLPVWFVMELHNAYWTLRHGQSKANVAGIIVSTMTEGLKPAYALTAAGRQQATNAGKQLAQQLQGDNTHLLIFASPFSRTRETAECVAQATGIDNSRLQLATELRERHFGCYELTSHDNYASVWAEDAKSADFRPSGGAESVKDVAGRLLSLIKQIESKHTAQTILLVAHGDTLSILWALVTGQPLENHRSIALQTGELRQLFNGDK